VIWPNAPAAGPDRGLPSGSRPAPGRPIP